MKKRDLEGRLLTIGWYFLRSGSKHDIWTNGVQLISIPRHKEINLLTAEGIMKFAKKHLIKRSKK